MKTSNVLTFISLLFFYSTHLFAADRIVQQGGPVGTYATITAAITAAADGDNIVVNNRTDGLPWLENLTINKSLTFVSAVDNIQWWMEGTITLSMAEGRQVTIVGLRNTSSSGNITRTGSTPVNRTVLNILYSDIAGDITMGSGINFYLGASKVKDVTLSFGKIYGCDLRSLIFAADAVSTEDINQVVGNRIGYWNTPNSYAFGYNSTTQYLFFSNNYVRSVANSACIISSLKAGATTNRIINSTLATAYTSFSSHGIVSLSLNHSAGQLSVENNVLCGHYQSSSYGSNAVLANGSSSSFTTFTYNMYFNYFSGGTTLSTSLNNFSNSNANANNINQDGGVIAGGMHIDAGNPTNSALDLDLTRNDVGVFGGSYSMANFLPLMSNVESSRVNFMTTPRVVNQGGTVNVQAIGFDK